MYDLVNHDFYPECFYKVSSLAVYKWFRTIEYKWSFYEATHPMSRACLSLGTLKKMEDKLQIRLRMHGFRID